MEPKLWCPFCGSQTQPGEFFCSNCGNHLLSATPSSKPPPPIMGEATLPNSPDRGSDRKGVQAIRGQLWRISCILEIIAVFLGLIGFFALVQIDGNLAVMLIFWVLGISLAMYNYKIAFPDRKRARTLVRLFEIMVIMLGLLGFLAGIFKIGGAWSELMFLPLINLPIATWRDAIWGTSPSFYRRQERRLQRAMHYVGEHGVITITVYCKLTDVPEEMARSDLEVLVRRGALRATGNSQTGQYWFP
jgi:hypothetical protein